MKCLKCKKLLKENTDGNLKYCQGHDMIEHTVVLVKNVSRKVNH